MAYTPDSIWRNRDTFLSGRDEIVDFLTKKWAKENGYRLRKELFSFTDNKVSVPRSSSQNIKDDDSSNFRSQFSSGTSGTTNRASGGGRTAWRIGRLRRTV
jgi:nuclear transport factor 2 (NTF2) superfamily protein